METITLRTFTTFMLATALLAVGGIWLEARLPEAYFKLMASCFVLGFASFLLWAPLVVYRFLTKSH